MPAVNFADPFSNVVKEIPVVGHCEHGALIRVEELLQPQDRFRIQVVGRLVKQQQVRGFKQEFAQCYAAAFAT